MNPQNECIDKEEIEHEGGYMENEKKWAKVERQKGGSDEEKERWPL